jgi:hypothetical protein
VLALALGTTASAQSFDALAPACHFTVSASKALRALRKVEPTKADELVKVFDIFTCDVQDRLFEAMGREIAANGKGRGEIDAILDQLFERRAKREIACRAQMSLSERETLAELPEDDTVLFVFRLPCLEQRMMLRDACMADATVPLVKAHCDLELQVLHQAENAQAIETLDPN